MKKALYITLIFIAFFGCKKVPVPKQETKNPLALLTSKIEYIAGENIFLAFKGNTNNNPILWLQSSFGSMLLSPDKKQEKYCFTIPKFLREKAGLCTWQLVNNNVIALEGCINILPNTTKKVHLESYLGPKSITAGGIDFSMLVVAPTDLYDNPLADNTTIALMHQFNLNTSQTTSKTKNGIAWKNIYSTKKAGRMSIAASYHKESSTEMTTTVDAAKANSFTIGYSRNHQYADGNQIITFYTDIITDTFGNIITDGTLVSFVVTNDQGMLLKTTGTTINGIARGRLLHPYDEETWSVIAYITGASKSNTILLYFEAAIQDYKVLYSEDQRTINIENIQSFMHQLIPDGIPILLEIKNKKGVLLKTIRNTSRLGKTKFNISKDFYPNGTYHIGIHVAGITQNKTIVLE